MNKDIKQPNNIKLIRSNRRGFGIHSPYVYHLVAKVIFDNKSCSVRSLFSPGNRKEMKISQMILRIAGFLKSEKIVIISKNTSTYPEFSEIAKKIQLIRLPGLPDITEDFQNPLVIWYNAPGILDANFLQLRESCWILVGCKDLKMKEFMNNLRNSQNVSVTIEVNNSGIVIFNENFQKQNYVIYNWFLYLLKKIEWKK